MEQETDKMEDGKECEVQYAPGDLLWAKIGHFPYWPCMVSYDPSDASYCKKKKIRSGDAIVYHVQYFGEKIQHGWTTPGLVMPYEGEKAFYDKKEQLIATKSSHSGYNVPSNIHKAWAFAVKEAEEARECDIDERYQNYVFIYEYNSKKSTSSKKSTKKRKSNWGSSKKPKKAKELNGTDSRVCSICDKGNVDLLCSGSCSQYFHKECLGILVAPNNFRCVHCEKGLATCFVCKKSVTCIFHCNKCELKYHHDCVKVFPCVNMSKNLCSHHGCLTCENRKYKCKGALVHCIRCPTSFHANKDCLPAGSVKLSTTTMICPDHFWGKNKVSPQVTSNVSYCFSCSEGGELICCESCPNSFHAKCIGKEVPEEDFFCEDCEKRQFLYVGMIVWTKTGNFRWWPAQIADVEDLPLNVKNMEHFDGEFPVQFFGTEEYFWTHKGRVIPYSDNHKGFYQRGPKQSQLDNQFRKSLTEASEAYDEYRNDQRMLSANKGNEYKHIQVNRLVPPAQIDTSVKKSYKCTCTYNESNPLAACAKGSSCLNASTNTECHPRICNAGEHCENQKFQKRQYAKVKVFKTENRGWGLQADQFIPKGMFVIEYVGEIITHEEYRRRVVDMQERNEQNYYFLYLDARRMIDAGPSGNLARFINHACTANCVMAKWSVNGDARIGIFALEDIPTGTELTFNYQYDDSSFQHKCVCGTTNCQGVFGKKTDKVKRETSKECPKKKSKEKVKKK